MPAAVKEPSIQDLFLEMLRKEGAPVSLFLVNGIRLQGQIASFDRFSVVLAGGANQFVYKHAIATVVPMTAGDPATRRR